MNFDFDLMQEPSGRVADAQVTQVTKFCILADLLFCKRSTGVQDDKYCLGYQAFLHTIIIDSCLLQCVIQ